MTGEQLKDIRQYLGLTTVQLGRTFGYRGTDVSTAVTIRKYESGGRPVPVALGKLALMFRMHGVPDGWTDFISDDDLVEAKMERPNAED